MPCLRARSILDARGRARGTTHRLGIHPRSVPCQSGKSRERTTGDAAAYLSLSHAKNPRVRVCWVRECGGLAAPQDSTVCVSDDPVPRGSRRVTSDYILLYVPDHTICMY